MKFWSQKRWKQIVFVVVLILILMFVAFGTFAGLLLSGALSREVVSEIDVKNADGSKTALIVYQPGFSSFPKDVSYAFADGLASSGWRVEITTVSSVRLLTFRSTVCLRLRTRCMAERSEQPS